MQPPSSRLTSRTSTQASRAGSPSRAFARQGLIQAAILSSALLLDHLGEPPTRLHPVGWIGMIIQWLDDHTPEDASRHALYGSSFVIIPSVFAAAVTALIAVGARRQRLWLRIPIEAALLTWTFSLAGLERAAAITRDALMRDDLSDARTSLTALVSRPTETLAPELVAAATIESLAENTGDSVVAPLFYWALGGAPLAAAYRAINTADSMVGYHGHYEWLGKISARTDDLVSWLPARLAGLSLCLAASTEGRFGIAYRMLRRDAGATESPNAGHPMAAMAGACGVRLEKLGHYVLGAEMPAPGARDITQALAVYRRSLAIALCGVITLRLWRLVTQVR